MEIDAADTKKLSAQIAARVRALRQERGWTQRMLDYRASLSRGYSSKLENGQIENPGVLNLESICRALQVPISWVLTDTERAESSLPPLAYPELQEVTANLAAIQEHAPDRLAALRAIILDVREQAERKGKQKSAGA